MKTKLLDERGTTKTYAVVFDKNEEFVEGMTRFASEQGLDSSYFTAIGGFKDAVLEFFSPQSMDYVPIPLSQQAEVLTMTGNVAMNGDERKVHAHCILGFIDGSTRGGHVKEAHVWPTLEVVVEESPSHLRRKDDSETGLALLDLGSR
ncbi:MAG TPA: PPC domain-containing DNA-binding protein [Dehalococcoidia bacterium]|nr:PPC domain-containing DNA-binding protein [Dehalococcoidia bacterium]